MCFEPTENKINKNKDLKAAGRALALLLAAAAVLTVLFGSIGCAPKEKHYADGTYEAKSDYHDPEGGYGKVKIVVEGGRITSCVFSLFSKDGSQKDQNYGKDKDNDAFYKVAQRCLATADDYAAQLVEKQSIDGVDAISGATWNYDILKSAVKNALKDAEKNN